jgi:hypothetical protein
VRFIAFSMGWYERNVGINDEDYIRPGKIWGVGIWRKEGDSGEVRMGEWRIDGGGTAAYDRDREESGQRQKRGDSVRVST